MVSVDEFVESELKKIPLSEWQEKEICWECVATGVAFYDSLHNSDDMNSGPITSDIKCLHCYDTEEQYGRQRLTPEQIKHAEEVVRAFRHYQDKAWIGEWPVKDSGDS